MHVSKMIMYNFHAHIFALNLTETRQMGFFFFFFLVFLNTVTLHVVWAALLLIAI
jgi:hypothetical protein